jgi:hypothetical protein
LLGVTSSDRKLNSGLASGLQTKFIVLGELATLGCRESMRMIISKRGKERIIHDKFALQDHNR